MVHSFFSARDFDRLDERDDAEFYSVPRLVMHMDRPALAAIGDLLLRRVPPHAVILDLMSSWRSHLPAALQPARVVGLGMNGTEMEENDQLDEWVIHDLTREPTLPFADATFDVVLNTASVQYLVHPVEVFREVFRVLRAGGRFIVTYSNRLFPTKAVRVWRETSETGRVALVRSYFEAAGGFTDIEEICRPAEASDQHARLNWLTLSGDPVYMTTAVRPR